MILAACLLLIGIPSPNGAISYSEGRREVCARSPGNGCQAPQSPEGAKDLGLSRVLDKRARTYAVHLELSQNDLVSTSDYNIELRPDEPKKPKKGEPPPVDKPKPGTYLLRLTDLRWKAGTLSHHSDLFGSGIVSFEEQGFPSAFLSPNWVLSPLLGFYSPGGGVASLSDLPIADAPVGVGWTLTGKARLEAPVASGQPMSLTGTLKGPGAAELQVSATSIFDAKTGWPKSCSGTLQGASLTVTWSCKLR